MLRSSVQALIVQDQALLVVVKSDHRGDIFILPGGGQEFGETLTQALERECLEELGAKVLVEQLISVREFISHRHENRTDDTPEHIVNHIFACKLLEPALIPHNPDPDQRGIRWLALEQLEQVRFYPQTLARLLSRAEPIPFYLGDVN